MDKNKFSQIDEFKKYVLLPPILLELMETFANPSRSQFYNEKDGMDDHYYMEYTLDYDSCCDAVRSDFREGKNSLTKIQIREILRLNIMLTKFDEILYEEGSPDSGIELSRYMKTHPYWQKIIKQAQKTLQILRKD